MFAFVPEGSLAYVGPATPRRDGHPGAEIAFRINASHQTGGEVDLETLRELVIRAVDYMNSVGYPLDAPCGVCGSGETLPETDPSTGNLGWFCIRHRLVERH